ncbi:MAG: flagellar hook-length control protein FliK [Rhodobacteraceae bacterium]|nr:flagellar hook-length control protein FliK [Paracoccaceae bacterium]
MTEMAEFPESWMALKPGSALQASGRGRHALALAAPQDLLGLSAQLDEIVPSWPRSGQKSAWNQSLPFAASPSAMLETVLKNGSMPSVPEHVLASAQDLPESPAFANAIGNVQSGPSQILAPALTAQMAQSTVAQVAQAIWQAPNDHVELVLSPDELGRVRIQMQHSEAGLQVLIATDRPETLDLLRKNIGLLSRALSDLGYGSTQFHFGEEGREQKGRQAMTGLSFAQSDAASLPAMTSATPPRHSGSSGLDLRF